MKFLRIILLPLIPVYAFITAVRNYLFDRNIFKSTAVNAKVISVGNLTVGGSGKTPTVIYLLNLLKEKNLNSGVLSRGYGRKSKGYLLVSKDGKPLADVEQCGDEIYHTVTECSVAGAVSENRVEGANNFINDAGVSVIVLDDAFQHRWIKRDVNLLIFEQRFLWEKGIMTHSLLPTGIMRESFSSVKRADAVIINRKFSDERGMPEEFNNLFGDIKVFKARYAAVSIVDIKKKTSYNLNDFEGQKSLVVSGIANPFSFINILKQNNIDTANRLIFRDHKEYTHKEVQQIRKDFYSTNSHSVITTEKDAVKLTKFSKELDDIDIFYLKISLKMDDPESFDNFLTGKLKL